MNELGPLSQPGKLVIFNPDDPTQVRKVTATAAWVSIASATFSQCAITLTATGAFYYADLPAGLDADRRVYPVARYGTTATAFTDPVLDELEYVPEFAPSNTEAVAGVSPVEMSGEVGTGTGDTEVTEDTPTDGYLRYVDGDDVGIDNANVIAYLKSDYDAGTFTRRGRTVTDSNGDFVDPLLLNSGLTYTILLEKPGEYGPDTREITVQ